MCFSTRFEPIDQELLPVAGRSAREDVSVLASSRLIRNEDLEAAQETKKCFSPRFERIDQEPAHRVIAKDGLEFQYSLRAD